MLDGDKKKWMLAKFLLFFSLSLSLSFFTASYMAKRVINKKRKGEMKRKGARIAESGKSNMARKRRRRRGSKRRKRKKKLITTEFRREGEKSSFYP